ncbi:hypothetical protein AB4365_19060, partial [Vibrio breoganii]
MTMYTGLNLSATLTYTLVIFRFYCLIIISLSLIQDSRLKNNHFSIILRDLNIYLMIHFIIAMIQKINPGIGVLFIPSVNETQSSFRVLALGNVPGAFANSIELAFFSFVCLLLNIRIGKASNYIFCCLAIIVIYLTGSKATLYFALLLVVAQVFYFAKLSYFKLALMVLFIGTMGCFFLVYYSEILMSSAARIDNMYLSRLGIIFVLFPQWVSDHWSNIFLGTMPDFYNLAIMFRTFPETLAIFLDYNTGAVINDVFWVAIIFSFGLPNFIVLITLMIVGLKKLILNNDFEVNYRYFMFILLFII